VEQIAQRLFSKPIAAQIAAIFFRYPQNFPAPNSLSGADDNAGVRLYRRKTHHPGRIKDILLQHKRLFEVLLGITLAAVLVGGLLMLVVMTDY
jgi:hypothetical protein